METEAKVVGAMVVEEAVVAETVEAVAKAKVVAVAVGAVRLSAPSRCSRSDSFHQKSRMPQMWPLRCTEASCCLRRCTRMGEACSVFPWSGRCTSCAASCLKAQAKPRQQCNLQSSPHSAGRRWCKCLS